MLMIFTVLVSFAQTDLPRTQPLKIDADNKLDVKNSPNRGTALNMPSVIDKNAGFSMKDSMAARNVKMLPDRELKQAGFDLKLDPKVNEQERGSGDEHFGDMYLGDVKTKSNFIGIVCRDHEYVDGDRVKISVNGMVVEPNILLTGAYKGVNINLESGFNRLDFQALNQGTSGPNTAQVEIFDENGVRIHSKKWLLSTGSKASLIVVKED